jgi:hypothetical protein
MSKKDTSDKRNSDLFIYIAFGFLIAFITYTYVISELSNGYSDYSGHAYIYLPYFFSGKTLAEGLKAVPYCMWHLITLFFYKVLNIALDPSAAYTSCIFAIFSYGVSCFMIDRINKRVGAKYSAGYEDLYMEETEDTIRRGTLCCVEIEIGHMTGKIGKELRKERNLKKEQQL